MRAVLENEIHLLTVTSSTTHEVKKLGHNTAFNRYTTVVDVVPTGQTTTIR